MKTEFKVGASVVSKAVVQNYAIANMTSRRAARLIVADALYDAKGEAVMYECQNKYGILGLFDAEDIEAY